MPPVRLARRRRSSRRADPRSTRRSSPASSAARSTRSLHAKKRPVGIERRHVGEERRDVRVVTTQRARHLAVQRRVVERRRAGLQHVDAAVGQPRLDQRENVVVEERVARRVLERLGEIRDDRRRSDPSSSRMNASASPTITRARGSSNAPSDHSGRYRFERSTTSAVDVDHRAAPHVGRAQALRAASRPRRRPESARRERSRGGGQRRMHQRLVIDLLVALRALRVAVENQHLAENRRTDDRRPAETRSAPKSTTRSIAW